MNGKYLLAGIIMFLGAHFITFYQLNGQFLKSTDWFRKNEFLVASAGIGLSYFYIYGTKYEKTFHFLRC